MPPVLSLEEKLVHLRHLESYLPAVIIIHNLSDLSVFYMSGRGREILGVTAEELNAMGQEYHARYFNPEDNKDYAPKIIGLLERNNDEELVSYFQQVRPGVHTEWRWYLTGSMIFHRDQDGKPSHIISMATPVDAQHHMAAKAQRLLEENNFLRMNHEIFDALTRREKEILRMMAQGLSSAQMGRAIHISPTTAATHRKNIKRKLGIKTNYDVMRFAQAFDLI
jgi:DNA-binding CsgD family transcriptional regulator